MSYVQLPSDTSNTGKKIQAEQQTIGADTVLIHRFVQGDKTADQTVGVTAKGTQGAFAAATQDLKDAGRVIYSAATVIAGVTAVTTEALLTLTPTRDGVAGTPAGTLPITAGKRLRATSLIVGCISTSAAVLSGRVTLRMNPSGAAVATSPILVIMPLSIPAALAQVGDWVNVPIPDGIEFSGTHQFGITQVFSATTGTVWASLIGYEY